MPKLLLVEDNPMNRDMLTRRLVKRGFEIIAAEDGQTGIDMARSEKPALILMDMSLPVKDGWTATKELKAAEDTKKIPIIGLSAHAMESDRQKAMQAGCDDYDIKPVELARLLGKIDALLKKNGAL